VPSPLRTALLAGKGLVFLYLAYLTIWMATSYAPQTPGHQPPFLLWVIDIINLYIHEAGHFFFRPFGQFIHVLGGSLFQFLVPLTLTAVTFRQTPQHAAYPLFWTGESLVNVSPYIQDAPVMKLRLIARGLMHDWNYLLGNHLDWAEPLGDMVFLLGILVCTVAIGTGVYFAIRLYRQPEESTPPE
jgi:hypothetical protein